MTYTTRDIQARLAALGYDPGPIDGLDGLKTRAAIAEALKARNVKRVEELFHTSGLHRIILHWTAGADGLIELERQHYHLIIDREGRTHAGALKPEANANCLDGSYAAHTRALNTGSIGVALDAMADAKHSPFEPGKYPITQVQVQALVETVADLCETYQIPVSPYSVLTHAEVQPTLGVKQRSKWDIAWLPDMALPGEPVEVGDKLRSLFTAAGL
ncbi:peptidoglycan recognition protein family protein [Pseudovibrio sp. WM33]|uniref:peptidoglycan recognition protein family protein n=1 Tax=Pseudovibrio sp. WM33 TaxID=1735585 RepID=UPI0007AE91B0|nr:N-acetylmuramoyl-L-alanine amidase [Pseudovibrio sp. WM33]KZL25607.1 N-acetylmuramoyl-L-alanine amidase [Pseudovibrio sp. WM33]